ncbi:MAG: hypothetical protein QNJ72_37745 [Pleurocapsa sp. MO_226.B13]|nr:hypothetical protein [Pleurocapsa sp. MO_226.B13]
MNTNSREQKAIAFLSQHPNQWFSIKEIWEQAFDNQAKYYGSISAVLHELVRKEVGKIKSAQIKRNSNGFWRKIWCFMWEEND